MTDNGPGRRVTWKRIPVWLRLTLSGILLATVVAVLGNTGNSGNSGSNTVAPIPATPVATRQ